MSSQELELDIEQDAVWGQLMLYLVDVKNENTNLNGGSFSQLVLSCTNQKPSSKALMKVDEHFIGLETSFRRKIVDALVEDRDFHSCTQLLEAFHAYHNIVIQILHDERNNAKLGDFFGFLYISVYVLSVMVSHTVSLVSSNEAYEDSAALNLKELWKSLNKLLLQMINLLDSTVDNDLTLNPDSMISLLACLTDIGKNMTEIETKSMILVYKCVLKYVTKTPELMDGLVLSIIQSCCFSLNTKLDSTRQSPASYKVVGFLMKLMGKFTGLIVSNFASRTDSSASKKLHTDVYTQLNDTIHRVCQRYASCIYGRTCDNALLTLEQPLKSVVTNLMSFSEFVRCALAVQEDRSLDPQMYLVGVILESIACSSTPLPHYFSDSFIESLTSFLSRAGSSLCQPCTTDPQHQAVSTCYEFALSHVCAAMVTVPSRDFPQVEKILVTWLLSQLPHMRLLAMDCWHFVARYSPDELVYTHCCQLMTLAANPYLDSTNIESIENVLARIVPILNPDMQVKLAQLASSSPAYLLKKDFFHQATTQNLQHKAMNSLEMCLSSTESQLSWKTLRSCVQHIRNSLGSSQTDLTLIKSSLSFTIDVVIYNLPNQELDGILCLLLTFCHQSSFKTDYMKLLRSLHKYSLVSSGDRLAVSMAALTSVSQITWLPPECDRVLMSDMFVSAILAPNSLISTTALSCFHKLANNMPCDDVTQAVLSNSTVSDRVRSFTSTVSGQLPKVDTSERWIFNVNDAEQVAEKESLEAASKRPRLDLDDTINSLKLSVDYLNVNKHMLTSQQKVLVKRFIDQLNLIVSE